MGEGERSYLLCLGENMAAGFHCEGIFQIEILGIDYDGTLYWYS